MLICIFESRDDPNREVTIALVTVPHSATSSAFAAQVTGDRRAMVALFATSTFLSAMLLFLIEPLIGRLLLPVFGGSAAVWNTCMVMFQSLLLVGYAWAHWSTTRLSDRAQMFVHSGLLLGSLAVLPFAVPLFEADGRSPIATIAMSVLVTIGLPFVLLSANGALSQRWYSAVRGADPFWLFATSNAGSLIGLVAYPVLFEPLFGLSRGWRVWVGLYLIFIVISAVALAAVFRSRRVAPAGQEAARRALPWRAAAGWLFRAAVGSSLLLSITMKMTTDLASAPVLWIVPLALYLLSFVLAFSTLRINRVAVAATTAIGIAWSLASAFYPIQVPLLVNLGALLGTLFFGSLLCNLDLAASRPEPALLTHFYLWIAAGGAAGGMLNSIAAPLLLDDLIEFPVTLGLLAIVIHARGGYLAKFPPERMRRIATWLPPATVVVALCGAGLLLSERSEGAAADASKAVGIAILMPLAMILFGLLLARHAGQFEFAIACVTIFAVTFGTRTDAPLAVSRSFFGVMRVHATDRQRLLIHGTTVHGTQWSAPHLRRVATGYYHPAGPFGQYLVTDRPGAHIGVIGLGVGALAGLGRPGQKITFIEIDRDVETLARRYFTYLADSRAAVSVLIGDGRLLIEKFPDRSFDLLVVDAFSSDAVPTHLLTHEALDLYMRKVSKDGLVLLHVSNRYLDLFRPVRDWRNRRGHAVAFRMYYATRSDAAKGAFPVDVVAIAPDRRRLAELVARHRWRWLRDGRTARWTDDKTDLLAAFGKAKP